MSRTLPLALAFSAAVRLRRAAGRRWSRAYGGTRAVRLRRAAASARLVVLRSPRRPRLTPLAVSRTLPLASASSAAMRLRRAAGRHWSRAVGGTRAVRLRRAADPRRRGLALGLGPCAGSHSRRFPLRGCRALAARLCCAASPRRHRRSLHGREFLGAVRACYAVLRYRACDVLLSSLLTEYNNNI